MKKIIFIIGGILAVLIVAASVLNYLGNRFQYHPEVNRCIIDEPFYCSEQAVAVNETTTHYLIALRTDEARTLSQPTATVDGARIDACVFLVGNYRNYTKVASFQANANDSFIISCLGPPIDAKQFDRPKTAFTILSDGVRVSGGGRQSVENGERFAQYQ